jgi:hypothetical protein
VSTFMNGSAGPGSAGSAQEAAQFLVDIADYITSNGFYLIGGVAQHREHARRFVDACSCAEAPTCASYGDVGWVGLVCFVQTSLASQPLGVTGM